MANFRFSGHQTFVFRHGWLEKGVDLVRKDPHGFLSDNAIVELGVGKNMVESIKYWCLQTGLLTDAEPGTLKLTPFAEYVFGTSRGTGVDPYLEDPATLWLLHYQLVARAPISTASIVFNSLNKPEFMKSELPGFIQREINTAAISEKTIERDVDCFIHTYAGTKSKNPEDSFDCPLLELALIQPTRDTNLYRINIGPKQNLPPAVFAYVLLHFMDSGLSKNVYNSLYQKGSPGQVFKLDENSLIDYAMELDRLTNGMITFTDTAGLNTLSFTGEVSEKEAFAQKLLNDYFGVKA